MGWGNFMSVINVGSGVMEQQFELPTIRSLCDSLDPTGRRLVGWSNEPGSMDVFSMGTFELEHQYATPELPPCDQYSPAWHPSGEKLATFGEDCKLEVFNITPGAKEQEFSLPG